MNHVVSFHLHHSLRSPAMAAIATPILSCNTNFPKLIKPINKKPLNSLLPHNFHTLHKSTPISFQNLTTPKFCSTTTITAATGGGSGGPASEIEDGFRKTVQATLWGAEAVYILWLFLLPYAPGDPVWAISSDTINSLVDLSLNFFLILPFLNYAGIHLLEAPVLHPMSEGLFNFVIGWTFMFAPLLFTDRKRDRYKGSLDILWGFQMFLTNTCSKQTINIFPAGFGGTFPDGLFASNTLKQTISVLRTYSHCPLTHPFLIPYMAIRLNVGKAETTPNQTSQLGSVMTRGAPVVGLIGAAVCLVSTLWALYGRADGNFGDIPERLEFLTSYLGSERLAYAFIWDIFLYLTFQPWLIGDNLRNIQSDKVSLVNILRFVPVVGLAAYCLCLNLDEEF